MGSYDLMSICSVREHVLISCFRLHGYLSVLITFVIMTVSCSDWL